MARRRCCTASTSPSRRASSCDPRLIGLRQDHALADHRGLPEVLGGAIPLSGRDVANLPPEKRNIAMVFQSYALWPI
jgi:hypothetical protein